MFVKALNDQLLHIRLASTGLASTLYTAVETQTGIGSDMYALLCSRKRPVSDIAWRMVLGHILVHLQYL